MEYAEVSGQVEGAARSTGDVFPFACNAADLLDSPAALGTPGVRIDLDKEDCRPLVLSPVGGVALRHVIMPCRLKAEPR